MKTEGVYKLYDNERQIEKTDIEINGFVFKLYDIIEADQSLPLLHYLTALSLIYTSLWWMVTMLACPTPRLWLSRCL